MFRGAISLIVLTCAALAATQPAMAGMILQEEVSTYIQVYGNAPIGQTFTAEDESVSRFGFRFDDFNNEMLNGSTIVRLYEGDTITGNPIYVDSTVIAPGTEGLAYFSILPVQLNIGATYTLEIDRFNQRWGVAINQHQFSNGDPIPGRSDYSGGHAIINGQPAPDYDLAFQVIPEVLGDANIDGIIDGVDYLIWAANYGDDPADIPPGPPANGDLNQDGRVSGVDYIIWAVGFTTSHTEVSVPEPSSLSLALLAGALIPGIHGRRRRCLRRRGSRRGQ